MLHELKGVGENLQDHFMIGCQWRVKPEYITVNELSHGLRLAKEILKYGLTRKGLLTFAVAHVAAFLKSRRELEHPDLQFHMMAASMDLEVLGRTQALVLEKEPGLTCTPCQIRPESRGTVHIKSPDAIQYPSIVPNYLADPADQQAAVTGLDWARKIMSQPAITKYLAAPGQDPFGDTDESKIAYAQMAGATLYHAVGTCQDGPRSYGCRRSAAARLWRRGAARCRCVDHAEDRVRQHQRADDHDRRKGRRYDPRQGGRRSGMS